MAENKTTTDHDVIRRWVEERGGRPATVAGAEGAAALRIDFPDDDEGAERLEVISWTEFFDTFEEANLAFIYQEELVC